MSQATETRQRVRGWKTASIRHVVFYSVVLLLAFPSSSTFATWYGEGVESGADIMMMDLRWPWWPSGTYYANWNSGVKPQGGISFYAGFLGTLADGPGYRPNPDETLQDAFRPGHVWSFWGGDKEGNPVRFVDVAPNLCFKNAYGGEGCNASLHSEPWDFIQCKRWYTMLARMWQPTDPRADHAYIGRWIKDVENNRWHLIGIARLPVRAETFSGNSGFIETLSHVNVVRPLDRRFGYFRKDGQWHKSDLVSINKKLYVVLNVLPEGNTVDDDEPNRKHAEFQAHYTTKRPLGLREVWEPRARQLTGSPRVSGTAFLATDLPSSSSAILEDQLPEVDVEQHVAAVTTGLDGSTPRLGPLIGDGK